MKSIRARRTLLLCAVGLACAIGASSAACRGAPESAPAAKPRHGPIAKPHTAIDECVSDGDCLISVDRDCCNNCCAPEPYVSTAAQKRAHDNNCASIRCMNPHCENAHCPAVRAASEFKAVCENHQCRKVDAQSHAEEPSPLLATFSPSVCPRLQRLLAQHQDSPMQLHLVTLEQHLPVFSLEPVHAPGSADMTTDWVDTAGARFCTDGGLSGGDCIGIFPKQKALARLSLKGTAAELSARLSCGG